jgi:hypothetical protein
MTENDIKLLFEWLAEIRDTLIRMEARQIKTTAMVEDAKEHEAPVVGSFASSDLGDDKPARS